MDCSPARADFSSAGAERAERRMGFDPHPRPPTAIYSSSLRVWVAGWKIYPGQTIDAVSGLAKKGRKPHIGPTCHMRANMEDLLEML
jgi:hypothetical protein